ncbi:MAG: carbohydrate ABC transporter substrate-binding protein, partial [Spirochaetes bacterium]
MLVINSNLSDPAPKAAFAEVVEGFKAANPDIEVTLNSFDHEAYKTAIRNFLASDAPDVCLWFAGNRMKFFVDEGLFLDISDVWSDYDLNNSMSAAKSAVSVDG